MPRAKSPETRLELAPSSLRWRCDPARFKFDTTDDAAPPEGFIGQEGASSAMEVGLGIDRPGFNVFVTGPTGTGRTALIRSQVEAAARRLRGERAFHPPAGDWCYVFNFEQTDQPAAIRFDPGEGKVFAGRVVETLETVTCDLRNAFQSEAYQRLYPGLENAGRDLLLLERRWRRQGGPALKALRQRPAVQRLAEDVEHPAQRRIPHRDRQLAAVRVHFCGHGRQAVVPHQQGVPDGGQRAGAITAGVRPGWP